MNTINPPTTHAATRADVPGSDGRITSRNTSTATALFNAWPDGKLNPAAVAVGVSKLGRARATTSLSTNPSTLPAVIVIAAHHADIVREVQEAVAANAVVVVGMRQNPHPKKARKLLDDAGLAYRYLEYGSYFGGWRRRLALKMWTGWPTLPMVFVKGVLVGGASDLERLLESGELKRGK